MGGELSKIKHLLYDVLKLQAVRRSASWCKVCLLTLLDTAWGDGDALAEAGFCYAQGIGCKKDLKKSARFYRMAESKGISMVGNSWYGKLLSSSGPFLMYDPGYTSRNIRKRVSRRSWTSCSTKTLAINLGHGQYLAGGSQHREQKNLLYDLMVG
jgi:TPR repeat protein